MKISSNYNFLNFGKVFAVAGSEENMQRFLSELNSIKNVTAIPANDLYINNTTYGLCSKAAKKGNKICFVITGKEDNDKVRFMAPGWGTINGISKQLDEFILLGNIKRNIKRIIDSI